MPVDVTLIASLLLFLSFLPPLPALLLTVDANGPVLEDFVFNNRLYRWYQSQEMWELPLSAASTGIDTTANRDIDGRKLGTYDDVGLLGMRGGVRLFMRDGPKINEVQEDGSVVDALPEAPLDKPTTAAIGKFSSKVYLMKDTTNPVLYAYDLGKNSWTSLDFPFTDLDGKPHISLRECSGPSLYYESNYGGTFRYDAQGEWVKMENLQVTADDCFVLKGKRNYVNDAVVMSTNPIKFTSADWTMIMEGLPGKENDLTISLVVNNGVLFMSLKDSPNTETHPNGLWQFDEEQWWHLADPPVQYGLGKLMVVSGHLYGVSHNILYRFDINRRFWYDTMKFLPDFSNFYQGDGKVLLHKGGTTDPQLSMLTLDAAGQGTWRDLAFPFTGLDGKPHIDMLEDTFSDIWYKTNYDGVYHYDAQAETWELANNDSGALTLGADGTLYLSYEVTKHTQISTFFRYVRETKGWEQLHATRGYGIGGVALSPGGHVFMSGGRFGEFVVENTKLWEVQDTYDGQGLSSDESKGVSSKVTSNMASGVVYCVNKFAKQDQEITRIIGLKPALTSKHYYDSDLKMNYSSFLTHGVTEFETAAIKILLEKHLLLATNTVQEAGGTKAGVLQIISIDGQPREIDSLSLEAPVLDMDIDRKNISGHTVIATTKGLLVIKNHDIAALSDPTQSINPAAIERARYPTATELLHSSEHKRVSCCGPNGEIAAILDTTHNITVYHSDLSVQWTKTVSRSFVEDIAIDPDHELVIVVGFDNKKLPSGNPVQVAFVTAWSLTTGNFVMQLFGFDGADLSSNIADTRLYRAVIGPDRFLYIGGESAGTETIFRYDGKNYEGVEKIQKIDFYNDLWNTKSAQITYHARVDLAARTLLRGQLTMARLKSDGTSNTLRLKDGDLCVGSDGSIVLVGSANSQINNRDATRLDGAKVGEYAGAEPSLLWVRPDFRGRNGWSVMVLGDKHKGGTLNACDIWDETLAVSGHIKASSESNDTSMAGYAPTSDSAIIKEPLLSFPTAAEGDGVTTTLQAGWMATVPLRLEPMNITYTDDSDSTSADGDDSESSAVGREVRHGVLVSCLLLVAAATRFVVRA